MSASRADATSPRSGDRRRPEEHRTSSPSRDSSSKHGSRRDRDRSHDERRRERSWHSHRHDRDADAQRDNHSRDEDRGCRRGKDVDDEKSHRPSSSSRRHRHEQDQERESKRHRRHRDDDERHSSSRGERGPRRTEDYNHSDRDHPSSNHRHQGSRHSSGLARNARSRSRSPLQPASDRIKHPEAFSRTLSPPAPSTTEAPEQQDADDDAPNFAPSGLLAAESNTVNGVTLKYHEPPEARKPKNAWRMYCFKDGKEQQVLHLGAQSAYLLGRDRTVVDIPLDHESCSKQHAVLQFRQTISTNEFGDKKKRIHPYLIDLESSNGSYVNDSEIPTSRYYQLRTGDTLTFGASTREYVLLDESSA